MSQSAMLEVAASTPEDSALQRDTAGTWTRLPLGRRITLSDDTSKLLASLEGWRDESERKKTATRVRDAAKTRFERGYVVGGRVYGYKNERLPGVKGAARLKVAEEQAEIVRRIFRMAAEGLGLSRIARQLNAEGIAGPQRLSDAEVEKLRVEGKPVPVNQWSISGVREVLHRDLYRGVVTFGKVRRTGPKTRVKLPKQQWQTRSDEVAADRRAGPVGRRPSPYRCRARRLSARGRRLGQDGRARGGDREPVPALRAACLRRPLRRAGAEAVLRLAPGRHIART